LGVSVPNMLVKTNPICCLCEKMCECPYGNNPRPLRKRGVCCGHCNSTVVLVRMGLIRYELAKYHIKNLKLLNQMYMKSYMKSQESPENKELELMLKEDTNILNL